MKYTQLPKKKPNKNQCVNNEMVRCTPEERNCHTCGWNPTVARDRVEKKMSKRRKY